MALDTDKLTKALGAFIGSHKTQFSKIGQRDSQILELGALTVAAKHYETKGYTVSAQNLQAKEFRVKTGSRGHPWNFSWFLAVRDGLAIEIHGNLAVQGAYRKDDARYVVDVAVAPAGVVPRSKPSSVWNQISNQDLITFMEAKALVVYPMLVAQFIGIVHEIQPRFLTGRRAPGFRAAGHFDPSLISIGYFQGVTKGIVDAFGSRGFRIKVLAHFDSAIAALAAGDGGDSPLD
jgi:hypothetical protein